MLAMPATMMPAMAMAAATDGQDTTEQRPQRHA
jgi:hypothetical protein